MLPEEGNAHPEGAAKSLSIESKNPPLATETFDGKVHVEWDPTAAVTPIGQLPFFVQFLKVGDLF